MKNSPDNRLEIEVVSPDAELQGSSIPGQASKEEAILAADYEHRRHQRELGWIGKIFGGRQHAPTYGLGLIGLIALLGMIALRAFTAELRGDLFKILGAIVMAALGYLGGMQNRQ